MVSIAGGMFYMGAPAAEEGGSGDERPQHLVTVPPFYLGMFAVTQEQWKAVASLPKVNNELNPDPSHYKGIKQPVESVRWHEAMEFCARLSQEMGRKYRLPTEAEWEYACRAGTTTPFHFGETITPNLVNYDGNYPYASAPKGEYRQQTVKVGSFAPNAFGLYDMHGNVWEWCLDEWHENYKGAPTDGSAWDSGGNENDNRLRILRGGSWGNLANDCRSAYRLRDYADDRNYIIGFRLCSSIA